MKIKIRETKVATINGTDYPVVYEFKIAHVGWELDSLGYIVEINGQNRLLLSDHGEFELVPDDVARTGLDGTSSHVDIAELDGLLIEYEALIARTNRARELLLTNQREA